MRAKCVTIRIDYREHDGIWFFHAVPKWAADFMEGGIRVKGEDVEMVARDGFQQVLISLLKEFENDAQISVKE